MSDKPKRWTWKEWLQEIEYDYWEVPQQLSQFFTSKCEDLKQYKNSAMLAIKANEPYIEHLEARILELETICKSADIETSIFKENKEQKQTIAKLRKALESIIKAWEKGDDIIGDIDKARAALKECFGDDHE